MAPLCGAFSAGVFPITIAFVLLLKVVDSTPILLTAGISMWDLSSRHCSFSRRYDLSQEQGT